MPRQKGKTRTDKRIGPAEGPNLPQCPSFGKDMGEVRNFQGSTQEPLFLSSGKGMQGIGWDLGSTEVFALHPRMQTGHQGTGGRSTFLRFPSPGRDSNRNLGLPVKILFKGPASPEAGTRKKILQADSPGSLPSFGMERNKGVRDNPCRLFPRSPGEYPERGSRARVRPENPGNLKGAAWIHEGLADRACTVPPRSQGTFGPHGPRMRPEPDVGLSTPLHGSQLLKCKQH
jgi:hypothetical protein